mmetsp:Transcript_6234/g.9587  ORF Transcript_6234/g.9587 Transcript_6234/m.9587 type:complete len:286 (+) Transcript_6234:71-928(+)
MSNNITESSLRALAHLKRLKPYDGWSIEKKRSEVRLLRRSVPLTDRYFQDLHYESVSGNVVGIVSAGPPVKGQILVDSGGKPVGATAAIVFVKLWKPGPATVPNGGSTSTSTSRSMPSRPSEETVPLSDEQKFELMKYAGYTLSAALFVRLLLSGLSFLSFLVLPALFLYAVQTCPSQESFDAKRELKRVLRGHHLPEDHVDKPKGWLNETIARVQAAVSTELATGLGYEVEMTGMANAVWLSSVYVPSVEKKFLWLGCFGKWTYLFSMNTNTGPEVRRSQTAFG